MIVAYIGFFIVIFIGVGFFGAMFVDTILDWRQARRARKDQVWSELQRTNYERRRPAAK